MENLDSLKELEFSEEVEEMAIRLAAYSIIKELAKEELISEEELTYIREKNQIPVE